mgnify:FL=1
MESPVLTEVRSLAPHLWKSTLLSGVLAVIMGALMLAWPGKTLVVAATLFGVYLLISGIAQVFFAFSLHVTAGGRVLCVTGLGPNRRAALDRAYAAVDELRFPGMQFRRDIGQV